MKMLFRFSTCALYLGLILPIASRGAGSDSSPLNPAVPLEVVGTFPVDNAVAVQLDDSINLVFSAEIDPITMNASTAGLTSAGQDVPVAISVAGNAVTMLPMALLCLHARYTATAAAGTKDLDRSNLAADFSW